MPHVVEYPEQRAARIVASIITVILMIVIGVIVFFSIKNTDDNMTDIQMYKVVSIEKIGVMENQQYREVVQVHTFNPQSEDVILIADNLYQTGKILAASNIEEQSSELTLDEFYVFKIHFDDHRQGHIISIQQTP